MEFGEGPGYARRSGAGRLGRVQRSERGGLPQPRSSLHLSGVPPTAPLTVPGSLTLKPLSPLWHEVANLSLSPVP